MAVACFRGNQPWRPLLRRLGWPLPELVTQPTVSAEGEPPVLPPCRFAVLFTCLYLALTLKLDISSVIPKFQFLVLPHFLHLFVALNAPVWSAEPVFQTPALPTIRPDAPEISDHGADPDRAFSHPSAALPLYRLDFMICFCIVLLSCM